VVGDCGLAGQPGFFLALLRQWYATEKKKRVVVPTAFWWLSIAGSLMLLLYAIFGQLKPHKRSWVFIAAYAFTWIPYVRNLIIHRRHADAHLDCKSCGTVCPPGSNYCHACGAKLAVSPAGSPR
jgi:lipid-A-disaccharide synthase-like uncharacterized protein